MSYTNDHAKDLINTIQQITPLTGSNIENIELDTAKTLAYLLNLGIGKTTISVTKDYTLPPSFNFGNEILRVSNRSGVSHKVTADGNDTVENEPFMIIYNGETFDLKLNGTNWQL